MSPADGELRTEARLEKSPLALGLTDSFDPALVSARGEITTLIQAAEAFGSSPRSKEVHLYPTTEPTPLATDVCASMVELMGPQDFIKVTSFLVDLESAMESEDAQLFESIKHACKKFNPEIGQYFARFNFQSSVRPDKKIQDLLRTDFQSIQAIIGNEFESRAFTQAFDGEMIMRRGLDSIQRVELLKRLSTNLRIMATDSFSGQMTFAQASTQPNFERDRGILMAHLRYLKGLLANAAELQLH